MQFCADHLASDDEHAKAKGGKGEEEAMSDPERRIGIRNDSCVRDGKA